MKSEEAQNCSIRLPDSLGGNLAWFRVKGNSKGAEGGIGDICGLYDMTSMSQITHICAGEKHVAFMTFDLGYEICYYWLKPKIWTHRYV